MRAVHRLFLVAAGVDQGGQLVEREDDVGAELMLDDDGHLGGEPVRRPVQVRPERHPVVVDHRQPLLTGRDDVVGLDPLGVHGQHLAESRPQRQHLESAAVGERRPRPVHECAEAARRVDDVRSGLQIEVIGVGQHRLGPELRHGLGQDGFHRRLGPHRDERRGADLAVRGADDAGAPEPARQLGLDGEERIGHRAIQPDAAGAVPATRTDRAATARSRRQHISSKSRDRAQAAPHTAGDDSPLSTGHDDKRRT